MEQIISSIDPFRNLREFARKIPFQKRKLSRFKKTFELPDWKAFHRTNDTRNTMSGLQKSREQPHSDITIRAGEKDVHPPFYCWNANCPTSIPAEETPTGFRSQFSAHLFS